MSDADSSIPNGPDSTNADDAAAFAELRLAMVENQIRARGVEDSRVLAAMNRVPREAFVPARLRVAAYDDMPLPIGFGQTISQPYTVAFMCEALQLRGEEKVLEIGTGSGYAAAVLSLLAREVYTVERIGALAEEASARLTHLGYRNVHVRVADGTLGLADAAPFDAIVVTAGAEELPEAYRRQLADGGRIVIPLGRTPYSQTLCRFTRTGEEIRVENLGGFAFVPLIGAQGWSEDASRAPF